MLPICGRKAPSLGQDSIRLRLADLAAPAAGHLTKLSGAGTSRAAENP
jgi:hypothetical protein